MAIQRYNGTLLGRMITEKLADTRNIEKTMRVVQCALITKLYGAPTCTAGGLSFNVKGNRFLTQVKKHGGEPKTMTQSKIKVEAAKGTNKIISKSTFRSSEIMRDST